VIEKLARKSFSTTHFTSSGGAEIANEFGLKLDLFGLTTAKPTATVKTQDVCDAKQLAIPF
jgi:hypothetical protein